MMHGCKNVIPVKNAKDGLEVIFHTRGVTGMKNARKAKNDATDIRPAGGNTGVQTFEHHAPLGGVRRIGPGRGAGDPDAYAVRTTGQDGGKGAGVRTRLVPAGRRHAGYAGDGAAASGVGETIRISSGYAGRPVPQVNIDSETMREIRLLVEESEQARRTGRESRSIVVRADN